MLSNENDKLLELHLHWFDAMGVSAKMVNGAVWYLKGKMLEPFMPFASTVKYKEDQVRTIMGQFQASLVRFPQRISSKETEPNPWFLLSRQFCADSGDLSVRTRRNLAASEKFQTVAPVSAEDILKHEHLFHPNNVADFPAPASLQWPTDRKEVVDFMLTELIYKPIVQYYGLFIETKLIGFARCVRMSKHEIHLTHLRLLKSHHSERSMEHFIWGLCSMALNTGEASLFVLGSGPWDPTNVSVFELANKIGFTATPYKVEVIFKNKFASQFSFMQPIKGLQNGFGPRMSKHNQLQSKR